MHRILWHGFAVVVETAAAGIILAAARRLIPRTMKKYDDEVEGMLDSVRDWATAQRGPAAPKSAEEMAAEGAVAVCGDEVRPLKAAPSRPPR